MKETIVAEWYKILSNFKTWEESDINISPCWNILYILSHIINAPPATTVPHCLLIIKILIITYKLSKSKSRLTGLLVSGE